MKKFFQYFFATLSLFFFLVWVSDMAHAATFNRTPAASSIELSQEPVVFNTTITGLSDIQSICSSASTDFDRWRLVSGSELGTGKGSNAWVSASQPSSTLTLNVSTSSLGLGGRNVIIQFSRTSVPWAIDAEGFYDAGSTDLSSWCDTFPASASTSAFSVTASPRDTFTIIANALSGALFSLPTDTAPDLSANVSDTLSDEGLLAIAVAAIAFPLIFWVAHKLKDMFPKPEKVETLSDKELGKQFHDRLHRTKALDKFR